MYRSDEACAGRFCRRLIREMFFGIDNASRHTIEGHAKVSLSAASAGVIQNKKS
ncbi:MULTISPECIES: fructose-1,6-bisphosphatase [unclassified Herbaspirillum]|jgi:hypothetical protein|uniref:fructose-1,6-bisphosphatase n=1 Tax=unclassified Herbaspirillum TaxID=2624150 RepID=UPI0011C0281C|nr:MULTISPECIES: fructose-1,6-bisphosphatase [unclassified Herbaspirillum]